LEEKFSSSFSASSFGSYSYSLFLTLLCFLLFPFFPTVSSQCDPLLRPTRPAQSQQQILSSSDTPIPLKPANANTVHKAQGCTAKHGVALYLANRDFTFSRGLAYVALSRATSVDKIYIVGNRLCLQHFTGKANTQLTYEKIAVFIATGRSRQLSTFNFAHSPCSLAAYSGQPKAGLLKSCTEQPFDAMTFRWLSLLYVGQEDDGNKCCRWGYAMVSSHYRIDKV